MILELLSVTPVDLGVTVSERNTMDVITTLVTNLGVLGALVWYMYYTTAVTIPKINTTHSEAYKELIDQNNAALNKIATDFTSSLAEEREARKEEVTALKEWIRNEAKCNYNHDHRDRG